MSDAAEQGKGTSGSTDEQLEALGLTRQKLEMTTEQLKQVVTPILQVMNALQTNDGGHFTLDQVLMGAAWALGFGMGTRGIMINPGRTVEQVLPPVMDGYQMAKRARLNG